MEAGTGTTTQDAWGRACGMGYGTAMTTGNGTSQGHEMGTGKGGRGMGNGKGDTRQTPDARRGWGWG